MAKAVVVADLSPIKSRQQTATKQRGVVASVGSK